MSFEAWNLEESDPGRKKRLAVGYATAIAICSVVGVAFASIKAAVPMLEEEQPIAVELTPTVEAPKPPPPPPPPEPEVKANAGPKVVKKASVVPQAVPTDLPPEGDPEKPVSSAGEGEGEG
ncbi:MAG TPA: hypothetical protein PKA58_03455, partial [Polyangium sp.]|nr:hypothetical protein [Polyangium sp.]